MPWMQLLRTTLLSPLPFAAESNPSIEFRFSPNGGCTESVVREIGRARKSVRIQA